MRPHQVKVRFPIMHSQSTLWKTAIAVVIYVVLCMLILVFSPPDYAGRDGVVQTSAPASLPASSAVANQQTS